MEIVEDRLRSHEKTHEHDWESCPGSYKFVRWQYERIKVRCPNCNRKLLLCTAPEGSDDYGAEFYIPRHKAKTKRKKNI